jgi:CheY-like chemotaxis protein
MSLGLLLSDDLIFTSRVSGTARADGLTIKAARSVDALVTLAGREAPTCVLVDLQNPGLVLPDLLRRLAEVCPTPPRIVAYGSHVDAAALKAAREAGCDPVLPRSRFVEELPQALAEWFGQTNAG